MREEDKKRARSGRESEDTGVGERDRDRETGV